MVKRSPCLSCLKVGPRRSKSNDICLNCIRRIEYVRAIGDLSSTVSIEEASVSKSAFTKCKTPWCNEPARARSEYCKTCGDRNWYRTRHGIPLDAPVDEKKQSYASKKRKEGKTQVEDTARYETENNAQDSGYKLNVDLTDYPEIHSFFIRKATEELRTIPNQILWTLLQIVRNDAVTQ